MASKYNRRLSLGTALALLLALGSGAAQAVETPKAEQPAPVVRFDAMSVDTFAGAFLAARTADNDYDYPTAITLYRTALQFDQTNTEVRERLMLSLFMNGNFDEGVVEAEHLKDDPAVERITIIARGIEAIRQKDYAKAYKILKYEGPNELDQMVYTLLMSWGKFSEGKAKEALASIDNMNGPEWYGMFKNYNAGMMAAASGDIEGAKTRLRAIVTNRDEGSAAVDTYARAVMALASLEAQTGNKQKALDALSAGESFANGYAPFVAFRKTIESGAKPDIRIKTPSEGMASVLFSVGGALNQSVSGAPDRNNAQDIVAFYLVTSYALAPSAEAAVLLGGLAEGLEQPQRAIDWYSRVPADSPLRRLSELQLGSNLAQVGKIEEARKHLKDALAADPKDIRGYVAYGGFLSDQKEYEETAKIYDKAVEIIGPMPKRADWSIFFQRGIAYERLKKWDVAEKNLQKALELYPDQPQVLNYLGYSWVDMNIKLEAGLEMIRKAVEIRPDDGYIVDSLGWAYYRMGRYEEAVGELERAVELRAADPTMNDHLGDAYWRVGRRLEAIFQWRTALSVKPEEADIPKIRKKIKEGLPEIELKKAEQVKPVETRNVAMAAALPRAEIKNVVKPVDAKPETVKPQAVEPTDAAKPADAQRIEQKAEEKMVDPAIYTVNRGQSLWVIAKEVLGDGHRFREIIDLNPELRRHPHRLQPGQTLKLPGTKN